MTLSLEVRIAEARSIEAVAITMYRHFDGADRYFAHLPKDVQDAWRARAREVIADVAPLMSAMVQQALAPYRDMEVAIERMKVATTVIVPGTCGACGAESPVTFTQSLPKSD